MGWSATTSMFFPRPASAVASMPPIARSTTRTVSVARSTTRSVPVARFTTRPMTSVARPAAMTRWLWWWVSVWVTFFFYFIWSALLHNQNHYHWIDSKTKKIWNLNKFYNIEWNEYVPYMLEWKWRASVMNMKENKQFVIRKISQDNLDKPRPNMVSRQFKKHIEKNWNNIGYELATSGNFFRGKVTKFFGCEAPADEIKLPMANGFSL